MLWGKKVGLDGSGKASWKRECLSQALKDGWESVKQRWGQILGEVNTQAATRRECGRSHQPQCVGEGMVGRDKETGEGGFKM